MAKETGLKVNELIAELGKSPHGDLKQYVPTLQRAAKEQPELAAHLMSYNALHGQIRDSRVAFPPITLSVPQFHDAEYVDNSLAHMASLPARDFERSFRFFKELSAGATFFGSRGRQVRRLVVRYLRTLEDVHPKWERVALQHRNRLKALYAMTHTKPCGYADDILFKGQYPAGSLFHAVRTLKDMTPAEAAGTIIEKRIPFLIAMGALGAKMKDPDVVLALIGRMSPTELVTNSKMLEKLGIKTVPKLRAAYEQALGKAGNTRRAANTLKTTVAAEAIEDDVVKAKLQALQERQLDNLQKTSGPEGDWLVIGDCSGSMTQAIEVARLIAGTLARMVKGKTHLVFCNTSPRYFDVTGKTLDEITQITRSIQATGGTSYGCGLICASEKKLNVDGIALIGDGAENTPPLFADYFKPFCGSVGKDVPVYFYQLAGSESILAMRAFQARMTAQNLDVQHFDLSGQHVDQYSVLNLVLQMSAQRYGLLEKIMDTPLLKLDDVLKPLKQEVTV